MKYFKINIIILLNILFNYFQNSYAFENNAIMPGEKPIGIIGGTMWKGYLPSQRETLDGRKKKGPSLLNLMWTSKITKINFKNKVESSMGPVKATYEMGKAINFETKTIEDTKIKSKIKIGAFGIGLKIENEKLLKDVEKNKDIIKNMKDLDYWYYTRKPNSTNTFKGPGGSKVKIQNGVSLVDSLRAVFGQNWTKKVLNIGGSFMKNKKVSFGKLEENLNKETKLTYGLSETTIPLISKEEIPFSLPITIPEAKQKFEVDLHFVPLSEKEIKTREKRLKDFSKSFKNEMEFNIGFGIETEL